MVQKHYVLKPLFSFFIIIDIIKEVAILLLEAK